jgi:hypothetical protein
MGRKEMSSDIRSIAVFSYMNRGTSVSLVGFTAKMAVPPTHACANSYKLMLRSHLFEPRSRGFPRRGRQTSRCTAGSPTQPLVQPVSTGLALWLEPSSNDAEPAQATGEKAVETASAHRSGVVPAVQRPAYQP